MLRSAIPTRFQKPWGVSAAGAYIRTVPVNSQIGIQDGAASFETGFVPDNFTPLAGGGVPPFGQDFNGVLNAETSWDQWYQARASIPFDATFAAAVGGYPQGAVLDSAIVLGKQWLSLVDNNLTNPDDPLTSTGWETQGLPSGTPVPFMTSTLPSGFIAATPVNTIGNAASGSVVAAASNLFLFASVWLQYSNTQCPILTSAGAPSTRGANPYADFAANKRLTLPDMRGLGVMGADSGGSSYYGGVPIVIGNSSTPGSILGENTHALINAELSAHAHGNTLNDPSHVHANTIGDPGHFHGLVVPVVGFGGGPSGITSAGVSAAATNSVSSTNSATAGTTISNAGQFTGMTITNANAGGGGAHNTTERNMMVTWGLKL